MKHLVLLFALFVCQLASGQKLYTSVSTGFQIVKQVKQPDSWIVHPHHSIQTPSFIMVRNLEFNNAANVDLNLGYTLNRTFGIETSFGYLKPLDEVGDDVSTIRTLSGNFWRLNPKFVLNIDKRKWAFNSKFGFVWSKGEINYRQHMGDDYYSILNYRYYGGQSFGFSASLGIERKMNTWLTIFTEFAATSQTYSPKSGKMTEYIIGGEDMLENYYYPTFQREIEFGEETEEKLTSVNGEQKNFPQKLYQRSISLGGYGLNLGVKFLLWDKK